MTFFHWYWYDTWHTCIAAPQAVAWVIALSLSPLSCRWEDFWEVSLRASEAHWEVFLSAFEQLFRQLVSRRTVQLSSYQLLTPLLPSLFLFLSVSFSLSPSPFVHWPVSWRLSDGCGWRMEVSQELSLMNALYTKGPICDRCTAPPVSHSLFQLCLLLSSVHFWMLKRGKWEQLRVEPWKLPEQLIYASYWLSLTAD